MIGWIKNRITLYGADQKQIDIVLDSLKGEDCEIDFNNIIPMPAEIKSIESGSEVDRAWAYFRAIAFGDYAGIDAMLNHKLIEVEGIETRDDLLNYLLNWKADIYEYGKHLYNLEKVYGFHDQFDWTEINWGTGCNAQKTRREGNTIVFGLPYFGATKLMLRMSEKFPDVTMDYEFADEGFGRSTARYTFKDGEIITEYEPEDDSEEARQLAKAILGWEPSDLFYNL